MDKLMESVSREKYPLLETESSRRETRSRVDDKSSGNVGKAIPVR
jgi:hypothetical protein